MGSGERVWRRQVTQWAAKRAVGLVGGLLGVVAVAAVAGVTLTAMARSRAAAPRQTVAVQRGDLVVTVKAGGALQAMKFLKLTNEAQPPWDPASEWKRAIVAIVDEGTVITEQDVKDGMVLAQMDASDLGEREEQAKIWLYDSEAWYAQASSAYEIQKSQNERDIAAAELNARFARLALGSYVGEAVSARIVEEKGCRADVAADAELGGIAGRDLRACAARVELAATESSRAEEWLAWTKQLHARQMVSSPELTADQHRANRARRELEAAKEELQLARRYGVPKEAKRRYSDYAESIRSLARTEAQARSRLAQAEADVKSSKINCELNQKRLKTARESIENCTIRAPMPGRVVYASTTEPWRRMSEPVEQGQRLWPHQSVIAIPDLSTLAARVNVQETDIEKIKVGQPARVSLEATPGRRFAATVARIPSVASLAQAQMNPELRVYEVDVALNETDEDLVPGMTATAEITVAQRNDTLYVPIGAVATCNGERVCAVAGRGSPELRRIATGEITDGFVEVTQGLAEGETICLDPGVDAAAGPGGEGAPGTLACARVARGDLSVTVSERGAVYSMDPMEVKCEVAGWNMLSEAVEEGTIITEKDVQEGRVLARLDSSNLEEQESGSQISVYGAEAALARAREGLEIQAKQNESDVALAEIAAEFARMEFEQYVGEGLAAKSANEDGDAGALATDQGLGGAAQQELRKRESEVELAAEELSRGQERLNWTSRLYRGGFASRSDLTTDELAVTRLKAALATAEGNQSVFKRYTLPTEIAQRRSDCVKLTRAVELTRARAASRLAQAEAQLRSAQAVYDLQKQSLDKVRTQIAKCTMRAPRAGQVVYGSRSDPIWYRWGDSAIRPGVMIEENRTIVSIPDPAKLCALVNVQEADVQSIKVGQQAVVTLEAVPGTFGGRVTKVNPVASSAEAELNPEARVYETEVALEEAPPHFIPGMAATVQIIAAELHGVLYVPRQAVNKRNGVAYCWVKLADGPQRRTVETGYTSVSYVEIKAGLEAGEEVLLAEPPEAAQESPGPVADLQATTPVEALER